MKNFAILVLLLSQLVFLNPLHSQERYWVFFTDKDQVEFDPYAYFDAKTIDKRSKMGFPLSHFSDLPVRSDYVKELSNYTDNVYTISRWLNAVSVKASRKQLKAISSLAFVAHLRPVEMAANTNKKPFKTDIPSSVETLRKQQISLLEGEEFEKNNIDGRGIRIAIFDAGFSGVDTSPLFEHIRKENRIIATWDFVKRREFVYSYNSHGTSVLTCIAGEMDGKKFGLASAAEFLLARTEISREVLSEEENWLAAMEWADKNGADIINSSLGYTHHRYTQKQMDGRFTLVSRAALMAAARGILVVNAAGNDGRSFWKVIGAPADADSILSVGGINPANGIKIDFSSSGPTFDGRMKPNVVASGRVAISNKKEIKSAYGTSFSAPLVSGFAACVMQMHPEWSNMDVYREIQKSGHLYPYFDYAHGFGIPQASYFTGEKKEINPTFYITREEDSVKIVLLYDVQKANDSRLNDSVGLEEKQQNNVSQNNPTDDYLYYHISGNNDADILKRYSVIKINASRPVSISAEDLQGRTLRVYHKGYSLEYKNSND
jgi:serine protease AprX